MSKYIPAGTKIQCVKCNNTHMVTEDIDLESLPLAIVCPYPGCGYKEVWERRLPPLAKCAAYSETYWGLEKPQVSGEAHEISDGTGTAEWLQEETDKLIEDTFQNKAEAVARHIVKCSDLMYEMRESLSVLEQVLGDEFSDAWINADNFHAYWKPVHLSDWLLQPYLPIPIDSPNEEVVAFTRYIASPKFFDFARGIPLSCTGGYYSYLVNAFSEASINTPRNLLKLLGIPKLNIALNGKHLTGSDLRKFEIPGVEQNVDHRPDFPSLYIVNSLAARTWLVRHGIRPWSPMPFNRTSMKLTTPSENMFINNADIVAAMNSVAKYGRIFLTNLEPSALQKIVNYIISCTNERFLFISNTAWSNVKTGCAVISPDSEQFKSMEIFKMFENVVLNIDEAIPLTVLEKLYRYNGRVLIYGSDAILDSLESCKLASLVYGLVSHTHFFFPYHWLGNETVNQKLPWKQSFSPQFQMTIDKIKELASRKHVTYRKKPTNKGSSET